MAEPLPIESPHPVTVLIVEDHVFARKGLRNYLADEGFKLLEAGDATTAWELAVSKAPQAAIVDILIPSAPNSPVEHDKSVGMDLVRRLKQSYPQLGIVILSSYPDRGREFFDLLREGVSGLGYQLKAGQPEALLRALQHVLAGYIVFDPQITDRRQLVDALLTGLTPDERPWVEQALRNLSRLTARERVLVTRLAESYDSQGVADKMAIQLKTVETHLTRIYSKLELDRIAHKAPHLSQRQILCKVGMIADLQEAS